MSSPLLNKKIVVTGHTGFKGSWLTSYLDFLGCTVLGISLPPQTSPNMYSSHFTTTSFTDFFLDITNSSFVDHLLEIQPDVIFHLAAQAIVPVSYSDPLATIRANTLGTAHVLEFLRRSPHTVTAVMITSDKVYTNNEWCWGYRENDILGGKDIYSSSKAAAELIISSYIDSFLRTSNHSVGIARAGNVIGGGDWSDKRLIPDIIRSVFESSPTYIRNPSSTRPWQHVLEPIRGYITLAEALLDGDFNFEPFNFGPSHSKDISVKDVLDSFLSLGADLSRLSFEKNSNHFHEAGLLKLSCDKAFNQLKWSSLLSFEKTITFTYDWYNHYYNSPSTIVDYTYRQISDYHQLYLNSLL